MIYFLFMAIIPIVLCWFYIVTQHNSEITDNGYARNSGKLKLRKNYSLLMYWVVGLWFVVSTGYGIGPVLAPHLYTVPPNVFVFPVGNIVGLIISGLLGCFIIWCFLKESPTSFIRMFQTPSKELRAEITKEVAEQLEDQLVTRAVQEKIEEIAREEYEKAGCFVASPPAAQTPEKRDTLMEI